MVSCAPNRPQVEVLSGNCPAPLAQIYIRGQLVNLTKSANVELTTKRFHHDADSIPDEQIVSIPNTRIAKHRQAAGQEFCDLGWR